jgi:hypothetical protein
MLVYDATPAHGRNDLVEVFRRCLHVNRAEGDVLRRLRDENSV